MTSMRAERVVGWVPYKVSVLVEMVVFSTAILVFFDRLTGRSLQSVPQPWGYVLVTGLLLTAATSLYGIYQQRYGANPVSVARGILWERTGQLGFGILLFVYGIWVIAAVGLAGFGFFGMVLSRSIAAILTVIKIDVLRGKVGKRGPS